jgi:hypothetical protein
MTTSGTASYNPTLEEIIEDAFERATGGTRTLQSGYDYRTARRSLNFLAMEWANRGVNLWTVEQGIIPLVAGVPSYQLPADTVDLIEYMLRTGSDTTQRDVPLQRISVSTFANIPNKTQKGAPTQIMVQRVAPHPILTLWPIPNSASMSLVSWRLRRIQDAGANGAATVDIPFRFIPAMVAGLAFHLSQKLKEGEGRAVLLKQEYEAEFDLASLEDREKATLRLVPRIARV